MATPQPVVLELFIGGAWVAAPTLSEQGALICQIGPDVETGTRASKLEGVLSNNDLSMDPDNIVGPYYGQIGRNTKIRSRLGGTILTLAEMSKWEVSATPEHVPSGTRGLAMTAFTAEGALRRIGRWSDPIKSAANRFLTNTPGLLGYFPGEDPSGASSISNIVTGGQYAATSGSVTYAGGDGPAGSAKLLKLGSDGQVTGVWLRPVANTLGFQIGWSMNLDTLPGSGTYEQMFRFSTSAGHIYSMGVNNLSFEWRVTTPDGTLLSSFASNFGAGVDPTKPTIYRIKVTDIGTQVQVEPAWYSQDGISLYGVTFAFTANTNGVLIDWAAQHPNATYGHFLATENTSYNFQSTAGLAAFNGYPGEPAGKRVQRLFAEEGLTFYAQGDITLTAGMGRQKPDVFLDLIEECLRTDGALLYDEPGDAGACTWVGRNYRQAQQTPTLSLTYPGHILAYTRVTDDTGIANDVTLNNADGAQVNVVLAAGPLSIQAPPNGISRVRKTLDVNYGTVADMTQRAQFELAKTTINRPRYTSLTVDMVTNSGLASQINGLRPGQLIKVTGLEPDPVLLQCLSVTNTIGTITRTITIATLPHEVYVGGFYDTAGSLYDSASTTLAAAATSTATTLALTTADSRETWPTSGYPYDLKVSGERVTVTRMSDVGSVANSDGTFETGALVGWSGATGGTLAVTTAQAHTGTRSALLTTTGTPTQTYFRDSPNVPVVAGVSYRLTGWLRSPTALANAQLSIDWFTAGSVYISTSAQTLALVANTWTLFDATYAAPGTAALAGYGPTMGASPATGSQVYCDDIDFLQATGVINYPQNATVTRSVNGVIKGQLVGAEVHIADPVRYA